MKRDTIGQPLVVDEFSLLYILTTWKEPGTLTRRISVTLILSSGFEKGGFCSQVPLDGMASELIVKWPTPLVDLGVMHKKWLTNSTVRYENIIQNMLDLRNA